MQGLPETALLLLVVQHCQQVFLADAGSCFTQNILRREGLLCPQALLPMQLMVGVKTLLYKLPATKVLYKIPVVPISAGTKSSIPS